MGVAKLSGVRRRGKELPDKTIGVVPEEDHTGGQLDPAQIALGRPVEPPGDAPELRQKRMAPLHRTANPTDPRLPGFATLGRSHPEARGRRPFLAGPVAIGTVGSRVRQVARIGLLHPRLGDRGLHDKRLQDRLGLGAIVDVRRRDHGSQRHSVGVARYMDRSTGLTTIDRRRSRVLTPLF